MKLFYIFNQDHLLVAPPGSEKHCRLESFIIRTIQKRKTFSHLLVQFKYTAFFLQSQLAYPLLFYSKALNLLDDYDHQCLIKPKGNETLYKLSYSDCKIIIDSMKFKNMSSVFGVEKENGKLEGILAAIYQNIFGLEVYPSLEEKAAHLLYFIVKDHPFIDGCKRIAATLFLEFLNRNHALIKNGKIIISNDTLVAITVLTADSYH